MGQFIIHWEGGEPMSGLTLDVAAMEVARFEERGVSYQIFLNGVPITSAEFVKLAIAVHEQR